MRCWGMPGALGAVWAAVTTRRAFADCAVSAPRASTRWSAGSDRLYLEGGGCIDLAGIVAERPGPLYHFDKDDNSISETYTGTFFLNSSMYILTDTTLSVVGEDYGGTSNELLLRSDATKYINLRAHGGHLILRGAKVFSWDTTSGDYDYDYEDGRSYINALTEVVTDPDETCMGKANNDVGEARMDIYESEIGYLGWYNKESYGLSWKARGLCSDKSNLDIFDSIAVYGDLINSEIHHLYFGHYSYGHQGGNWSGNHIHDNVGYGFDPHDDSDSLTIHNNHVHHNGWHGIIASKRCNNASIIGNHVHDNGLNGIMLHRSSDYGEIRDNWVHDNGVTGISIHETAYTAVTNNTVEDNKYGIRWNVGSSFTYCAYNTFSQGEGTNISYPIYFYKGSDSPSIAGNDGRPRYNYVGYNMIYTHGNEVAKVDDADDNVFEHNIFWTGNHMRFSNTTRNFVYNNTFVEDPRDTRGRYVIEERGCFAPGSDSGVGLTVCS